MGFLDFLEEPGSEVRHAVFELVHRLLEPQIVRLRVGVESREQVRDALGFRQAVALDFDLVLVEDGVLRVFKNGVGERVALLALLENLGVEIVGGVLGFPVTAGKELDLEGALRLAPNKNRPARGASLRRAGHGQTSLSDRCLKYRLSSSGSEPSVASGKKRHPAARSRKASCPPGSNARAG